MRAEHLSDSVITEAAAKLIKEYGEVIASIPDFGRAAVNALMSGRYQAEGRIPATQTEFNFSSGDHGRRFCLEYGDKKVRIGVGSGNPHDPTSESGIKYEDRDNFETPDVDRPYFRLPLSNTPTALSKTRELLEDLRKLQAPHPESASK